MIDALSPGGEFADAPRTVYVHFLDFYHLDRAKSSGATWRQMLSEGRRAARLSLLLADRVVLPASSFFESELARQLLRECQDLSDLGLITLAASEPSVSAHRASKLQQYDDSSPAAISAGYRNHGTKGSPGYIQRSGSSTAEIKSKWMDLPNYNLLHQTLDPREELHLPSRIESVWSQVPDRLEGRAFITSHALDIISQELIVVPEYRVARIIEQSYVFGYVRELNAKLIGDLVYLAWHSVVPAELLAFSYRGIWRRIFALGLAGVIEAAPIENLLFGKALPAWTVLRDWLTTPNAELTETVFDSCGKVKSALQFRNEPTWSLSMSPKTEFLQKRQPTIAIVTALPEEFVAMRSALVDTDVLVVAGDSTVYTIGSIPSNYGDHKIHTVVLVQLKRMGTNSAAVATNSLVRSFPSVAQIVMVGIACAVPYPKDAQKHVRLGDVVISDRRGIVQFDHVTIKGGLESLRDVLPPPSSLMTAALNRLESSLLLGQRPWDRHLARLIELLPSFRRPSDPDVLYSQEGDEIPHPTDSERLLSDGPRIFRGLIGSSNSLLRDSKYRDELAETYDLRAIEMESSGIAEATWQHERSYLVVRAACDYGGSRKNDAWHRYAAAVAASFARSIIQELPV